jgi:glutathione reductase (NADPH)
MASPFDLVVLGAGSGGLAAAKRAASYGAKVAIVEGDRVGGTCVIRGCVPKKLLVYGSGFRHSLSDAASYGWDVGPARCDASVLLANVAAEVDRLDQLHRDLLAKAGVTLIRGWGRFLDAHTVEVTSGAVGAEQGVAVTEGAEPEGSSQQLVGERILIGPPWRANTAELHAVIARPKASNGLSSFQEDCTNSLAWANFA